jgi:hypothetical protein
MRHCRQLWSSQCSRVPTHRIQERLCGTPVATCLEVVVVVVLCVTEICNGSGRGMLLAFCGGVCHRRSTRLKMALRLVDRKGRMFRGTRLLTGVCFVAERVASAADQRTNGACFVLNCGPTTLLRQLVSCPRSYQVVANQCNRGIMSSCRRASWARWCFSR